MDSITAENMKSLNRACAEFIVMHSRRNPTSKYATLGELDALMNLKIFLRGLDDKRDS